MKKSCKGMKCRENSGKHPTIEEDRNPNRKFRLKYRHLKFHPGHADTFMDSPLIIESQNKLPLPAICMRCGCDTRSKLKLKVSTDENLKIDPGVKAAASIIPYAHGIIAMAEYYYKFVKIPCCKRCKGDWISPTPLSKLLSAGLLIFSIMSLYFVIKGPIVYAVACFIISWGLLTILMKTSRPHNTTSLPIKVSYGKGRFHYEVFGGPLREYLSSNVVHTNTENPSNTFVIPTPKDDSWEV